MYKFITIKCRSCGSVIYNLPEKEFRKLRLVNLTCEDCRDHTAMEKFGTDVKALDNKGTMKAV